MVALRTPSISLSDFSFSFTEKLKTLALEQKERNLKRVSQRFYVLYCVLLCVQMDARVPDNTP